MDFKKPIVALDYTQLDDLTHFLNLFKHLELNVKIGMELFYANGPALIEIIKANGHDIFLDLKLYDIPNTVQKSMQALAGLGVDMVNVHCAGGAEMMEAAREGLYQGRISGKNQPLLIGVTQLTSMSEMQMQQTQLTQVSLQESVIHYAQLAKQSGLDGVVCSPLECPLIKQVVGGEFLTVTPGIRLVSEIRDDQKRIATPRRAATLGSDYIVVGRPITNAENPVEAYEKILKQWTGTFEQLGEDE